MKFLISVFMKPRVVQVEATNVADAETQACLFVEEEVVNSMMEGKIIGTLAERLLCAEEIFLISSPSDLSEEFPSQK